ncbi:MAG: phage protease, partial [Venatoribacter sp.]
MKKTNTPTPKFAIAALRVELASSAPSELRLLPAGHFKARDGRPHELPDGWYLDTHAAHRLIQRAKLRVDDAVIDYEHQTLNSEANGKPAPAAGWFNPRLLQWRADGLYATDVWWTASAKAALEAKEYRYFSPVIEYNPKTGEVLGVAMGALTNYAAIDGLDGLSQLAAAKFDFSSLSNPSLSNHPKESFMDREQLIALLGLAADATDEQITAAINELKAKAANEAEQIAALKTEVAALKTAPSPTPNPAQYAPVAVVEA